MEPLISVIVPVYNSESTIYKCLDSITKQTYRNLEIIIVNDGSMDNSLSICRDFVNKDNRITIISNEKNRGIASARNAGLEAINGLYVIFVDSDDYVMLDYVKLLYKSISQNDADIVECGFYSINTINNKSDKVMPRFEAILGSYEVQLSFLKNRGMNDFLWCKIFKTELFHNIRFSNFSCSEDFVLLCQIILNVKKVAALNQPLYCYIRTADSMGMKAFSAKKLDVIKAREKIFEYYRSLNKLELASIIAIQILSRIIELYSEVDRVKGKQNSNYKKFLKSKFEEYYPTARIANDPLVKTAARFVKFNLFRMFPSLISKIMNQ